MKVDFERLFKRGRKSYDTAIGDWWRGQSEDPAHRRAYASIASHIRAEIDRRGGREPRLFLDYACGNGLFLGNLAQRFPRSRLVGLDGSRKMLDQAQANLARMGLEAQVLPRRAGFAGPRLGLLETALPNFSLPKGQADAVAFLFPNITPAPSDQEYYDRHGYKNRADIEGAKLLGRLREMDPEDEVAQPKPDELFDGLMTDRVLARHARSLLRPGGLWFKVDYANAAREELGQVAQWRSLFSEGAIDDIHGKRKVEKFFAYRGNKFFRSSVIMDVYHQTKDPTDKVGGYFISVFEAV